MLPQAQGVGGGHPGVCGHVTPGTGSGVGHPGVCGYVTPQVQVLGGVTLETVDMWP